MELSYYFYTQLKNREDIDELLLGLMRDIIDEENKLNIWRREESEEGEGDTLDFSCKSFSVSTNLCHVQDISQQYHMKVNFCLWISIYRDGAAKFMEFIGKLLNETKGGALLIDENAYTMLERKNDTVIVNNYFCDFDFDFRNLGIMYLNGVYQTFYFQINTNDHMEDLKSKIIDIVKECIGEQSVSLLEDEDIDYEFEIGSDYFNVYIHMGKRNKNNVCGVMDLSIGIIYPDNDYMRLTIMINLLKRILKDFEGNCQLSVRKGYLIKEYILMERKEKIMTINENAEEKKLFYGLAYVSGTDVNGTGCAPS